MDFELLLSSVDGLRKEQGALQDTSDSLLAVSENVRTPAFIPLSAGAFVRGSLVHTGEVMCPPAATGPPEWQTVQQAQARIAAHMAALEARVDEMMLSYVSGAPAEALSAQLDAAQERLMPLIRATFRLATAASVFPKAPTASSTTSKRAPAPGAPSSELQILADAASSAGVPGAAGGPGVREVEIGGEVFSEILEDFREDALSEREQRLLQRRLHWQHPRPPAEPALPSPGASVSAAASAPRSLPASSEPLPGKVDPRAGLAAAAWATSAGGAASESEEGAGGTAESSPSDAPQSLPPPPQLPRGPAPTQWTPPHPAAFASTVVERFPPGHAGNAQASPPAVARALEANTAAPAAMSRFRMMRQQAAAGNNAGSRDAASSSTGNY